MDIYNEGEEVITLANIGKEGSINFIPKDTIVTFVKFVFNPNDLGKSIAVIQHGDIIIPVKDLIIRKLDVKEYNKHMRLLNSQLIKQNPKLGLYHPNFFVRIYYRVLLFLKKKESPKVDLTRVKDILKQLKE